MDKLKDLQNREAICKFCISIVEKVPDEDPRKESALENYQEQLKEIQKRIDELTTEEEKPADIVIGLKPAQLFGITDGGKQNG